MATHTLQVYKTTGINVSYKYLSTSGTWVYRTASTSMSSFTVTSQSSSRFFEITDVSYDSGYSNGIVHYNLSGGSWGSTSIYVGWGASDSSFDRTIYFTSTYTPATYTLSYNKNGGTSTPSSVSGLESGETVKLAGAISHNDSTTSSTGDTYTYRFNGNGGSSPNSVSAVSTDYYYRTYTFEHWYCSYDGSTWSAKATYTMPSSDVTMSATWDDSGWIYNYTSYGTKTLPSSTWSGHTLLGWYTASSGGTKIGDAGDTVSISSNRTLFAQWQDDTYYYDWTVRYYDYDGSSYDTFTYSDTDTSGGSWSKALPIISGRPTRSGYDFQGWSTTLGGSVEYEYGDNITVTATYDYSHHYSGYESLYAVYTPSKVIIPSFNWTGSDTTDNNTIYSGCANGTITATRWNKIINKIHDLEDAQGSTRSSITSASSGGTFYASYFNQVRNAIANFTGHTTLPSTKGNGDKVYASYFNGNNSLKASLNSAIDYHNDN